MPTTNGESSPVVTVTIASSRSARPSRTRPARDEHVSLRVQAQREEIAVAEALADRRRLAGDGRRRLEVARRLVPEHVRDQEVAVLDRSPGSLSSSRCARPSQPLAGPIAPR